MKKLLILLLAVLLVTAPAVLTASAGAAVDDEHGVGYFLWLTAADANACASGGEPQNQTTFDYGEIDGEAGVKLTYAPNGAVFDPYYSLVKLNLKQYKYCVMRYYFETPTDRDGGGNIFVRFDSNGGGSLYKNLTYEKNMWTTIYLDFTDVTKQWADDNAQITWLRVGHKVEEGEAFYIKYMAFFETMEEAEEFTGLADHASYNDTAAMAKALKAADYTNFELVENALKVDVSNCFFASEQEKIDNAERGILEAIGKLEKVPEQHGEKKTPSVPALEEITEAPTEAPTDAPTEASVPDNGSETDPASGGCKGLLTLPCALMLCAAAVCLTRRKED